MPITDESDGKLVEEMCNIIKFTRRMHELLEVCKLRRPPENTRRRVKRRVVASHPRVVNANMCGAMFYQCSISAVKWM